MDPIQWVFIVLLLLLIAAGIWMLTRNSAAGKDRADGSHDGAAHDDAAHDDVASGGVTSQAAGGEHVSAGDAGVSGGGALYDQEADAGEDVRSEDEIRPGEDVWDGHEGQPGETAGQDTATGADVPIVEEEPAIPADADSETIDAPYDQNNQGEHHERADHHDLDDHVVLGEHVVQDGDRDQMSYGDPQAEDFASETVYASAPVQETPGPPADADGEKRDPDQGSPGAGSQPGDAATYAEHSVDHHAGTENVGPQGLDEQWPDRNPEQGSPGASPLVADTPGPFDREIGRDVTHEDDQHAAHPSELTFENEDSLDGRSAEELIGGEDRHDVDESTHDRRDDMPETFDRPGAGSENPGPEEGEGDVLEPGHPDQGHPGPDSQVDEEASYGSLDSHGAASENTGPEEGEGDATEEREPDLGHPGPNSQVGEGGTYDVPVEDEDHEHDDVPDNAEAAGFVGSTGATSLAAYQASETEDDHHAAAGEDEPVIVDERESLTHDNADSFDAEGDEAAPVEEFGDSGRHRDSAEADEPQVVMVDVDDYSAEPTRAGTEIDESHRDPVHEEPQDAVVDEGDNGPVDGHREDDRDSGTTQERDLDSDTTETRDLDSGRAETADSDHDELEAERMGSTEQAEPEVAMVDVDTFPAEPVAHDDAAGDESRHDDSRHDDSTHDDSTHDESDSHDVVDRDDSAGATDSDDFDRSEHDSVSDRRDEASPDEQPQAEPEPDPEPAEPAVVASPYGPGSVFADEDGTVPSGYDIKGNAGSMLFHTPESPSYDSSVPEVYFESEDAARAAGFAHWDRKRR